MSRGEHITFVALVGLPLGGTVCLGLFARSLVGGGRTWPVWFIGAALCYLLWGFYFLGETLALAFGPGQSHSFPSQKVMAP
jgi:hypothetical protein